MKSILFFLTLCISLSLTQCKDDDASSCTNNPTEDLPWLTQRIQLYEQQQSDMLIFQVNYGFKAIFSITLCCHTCEVIPAYFDCDGNEITDIDYDRIGHQKLIWSLPTSDCGTYP